MMVSFLGTLGLALTMLYLIATVLNFVPGFAQLSRFMIGTKDGLSYGFAVLVIPALLIILHLYFRSQIANWLYNRGDFGLAYSFCEKRQTHNLLRSRGESFANKSILLALMIRDGKWADAKLFFDAQEPKKKNPFYWRWLGWGAELYWRLDETEKLGKLFEKNTNPGKLAERYNAVRAHYYFEEGKKTEANSALEHGMWNDVSDRVAIVSAIIKKETVNESAWRTYVLQVPSAANERALFFNKPLELGGDDPRTIRLIAAQLQVETLNSLSQDKIG